LDSGLVVSIVRSAADLRMDLVGDQRLIGITLPGNPCGVLLCCTAQGAQELTVRLADGLTRLLEAREREQ
jgi:hypothetical protein